MPDTQLRIDVALGAKSELSGVLARDVATVRQLEQAVLQLRRLTEQGGARGGGSLAGLPAVARVGQAQDSLAAVQRQASQAVRAVVPPPAPPPRVSPSQPSLVPRPDLGPGVFGAPGQAAAGVRPPSAQAAAGREPAWVADQRRLAALAGGQRGGTTQGPQTAREMADAAERLNRTLRETAGTTRDAANAEQARGKAVGGSSAAAVAASAALGAGVAAAAGGGGRGGGPQRTALREAQLAEQRGLAGTFPLPQFGGKQAVSLPRTTRFRVMREALAGQEMTARDSALAAESQAEFLKTPGGKANAQDVLLAQSLQRQQEAAARLAAARIPKGRRVAAAEATAFRDELGAGERETLEETRSRLREAGIRARRYQGKQGAAAVARQAGVEYQLEDQQAQERTARALALRPGIGGPKFTGAAAEQARAGLAEGTNAAAAGAATAQVQARMTGSKEGQDELKRTAQLRRQEAYAMRSVDWNRAVAEHGRFGASLNKVSEGLKGVGQAAGYAFAFRVAELGYLANAASPSHFATATGSFEMLSASMGKSLLPAVDEVSLAMQRMARWIDAADPGTKKGAADAFLWSTLALGGVYAGAKGIQGAAWAYGGLQSAGRWAGMAMGGAGAGAVNPLAVPGFAGPAAGTAAAGGPGGMATYAGISGTTVAIAALGAAALAAEAALLQYESQQRKAAYARNEAVAANLTRKDVVESEAYKRAAAAAPGQQEAVAGKEYEEASREFQAASKRAGEQGMYKFRNFFEGVEQSVGGRRATVTQAELERDEARKRMEVAKASYDEIVNKRKFQGGAGTPDAGKADTLLRSLRGLPQPFIADSAVEYANRIQLRALAPEGELDRKLMADQLKILVESKQLLADIARGVSPNVPKAANVNDRP